jgi:hypothetical protein
VLFNVHEVVFDEDRAFRVKPQLLWVTDKEIKLVVAIVAQLIEEIMANATSDAGNEEFHQPSPRHVSMHSFSFMALSQRERGWGGKRTKNCQFPLPLGEGCKEKIFMGDKLGEGIRETL